MIKTKRAARAGDPLQNNLRTEASGSTLLNAHQARRRRSPEATIQRAVFAHLRARASRRDAPVVCERCGRKVERKSRQQRFCSGRCQEKARTRVRKAFLARDTGAPGEPPKKDNKLNALQRAKTVSSTCILGPADVLAIEVFDRVWDPATSSGGIAIEVSHLRTRALVS